MFYYLIYIQHKLVKALTRQNQEMCKTLSFFFKVMALVFTNFAQTNSGLPKLLRWSHALCSDKFPFTPMLDPTFGPP